MFGKSKEEKRKHEEKVREEARQKHDAELKETLQKEKEIREREIKNEKEIRERERKVIEEKEDYISKKAKLTEKELLAEIIHSLKDVDEKQVQTVLANILIQLKNNKYTQERTIDALNKIEGHLAQIQRQTQTF